MGRLAQKRRTSKSQQVFTKTLAGHVRRVAKAKGLATGPGVRPTEERKALELSNPTLCYSLSRTEITERKLAGTRITTGQKIKKED